MRRQIAIAAMKRQADTLINGLAFCGPGGKEAYERRHKAAAADNAARAQMEADLSRRGLRKERTIAAVVRLLDLGRLRVGNEYYATTNKSFGATTLRRRCSATWRRG